MDVARDTYLGLKEKAKRSLMVRLLVRHAWWLAPLLAMFLTTPSLKVGWIMDDHWHRQTLLQSERLKTILGSPLDLFRFFDGDSDRTHRMMDMGVTPWWTTPDLRGAFWRPVSAITHWLDYQLWPDSPLIMHVHSVLWFGALVAVVGLLYRRLMGTGGIAALALLLYAVDDARGMPVGFLANRNAVIAAVFGVLTLVSHDCRRRDRKVWCGVIAPVLFTLSLLASEGGLATTAYLFAYAGFLDTGSWRVRLTSLIPYAAIVISWRVAWVYQGYGVSDGMGLYIDPLTDPAAYLWGALARVPILLLGQWALPPADVTIGLKPQWVPLWAVGAFMLDLVIGCIVFLVLRRTGASISSNARSSQKLVVVNDKTDHPSRMGQPFQSRRLTLFWFVGMFLSLPPICATFPSDRLLFFVGLGAMALIAQYLSTVFAVRESLRLGRVSAIMAVALGVVFIAVHMLAAPLLLSIRSAYPAGPPELMDSLMVDTPLDASVEQQTVVVVNAPSVIHVCYLPAIRDLTGEPVPMRVLPLAPGLPSVVVERIDDRTLTVRPEIGYLVWFFDRLFRSERRPLAIGERVELTGLTVEVTELTPDGRPAEALFRFDVPLEDQSLRWLFYNKGGFEPWPIPPIGAKAEIRPEPPKLWKYVSDG